MFTHLTAEHSDALVCTDSSDNCLGAVESPVSPDLHRELWRKRERRGWSTHLVGKAAEHVPAVAPELEKSLFAEELIATWKTRDVEVL